MQIIPGLYGFGTDTRAAYGAANPPEICIVDSLGTTPGNPSWDPSYGPNNIGVFKGTLIQCLEGLDTLNGETIDGHVVLPNSGKIVLFETSGTIAETGVDGATQPYTYSLGSYTTVAGQTSPNPGILLRNILLYSGGINDFLIQHIRGRMDGAPSLFFGNHKSFSFVNTSDFVVDHISSTWGADVLTGIFQSGSDPLEDFTVSNCVFAESRAAVGLVGEDPDDAKGLLVGASADTVYPRNGLLYGNVFMSVRYRAPALKNAAVLAVNNYSYNNKDTSIRILSTHGSCNYCLVGNVTKGGPMSGTYAKNNIASVGTSSWTTPISRHSVYAIDNVCDLGKQASSSDWDLMDIRPGNATLYADGLDYPNVKVTGENPPTDSPLWPAGLSYMPSSAVKDYVIANAGAYPAFRDSLDLRFIDELTNNTGRSSLASGPPKSGDWPVLAEKSRVLAIPSNPHANSGDGYTNLEKFLHALADEVEGKIPVPPPAKGQIVGLTHPASVENGAMCDINAAIKNIGELSGRFKTQILIDSILLVTSPEFTLAGGATSTDKIDPFKAPSFGESMDITIKCIRSE